MSNKKLEALKALFKKEKENKTDSSGKYRGDMYPFWQMGMNEKAVVRILPDKNEENPYMFFVDRLEHTLSIDGKDERIPCLHMYGEKCPICDLSREFYKNEGKGSVNGKYYYRKKLSLLRVLVVTDPLPPDEETGVNSVGKVLNTQFSYQLMEKIKEEISGDELESSPWDLKEGYNFIIKKTPQGEYGTYTVGSGFARKQTAIDEDELGSDAIIDLQTLLPTNPGYELVKRKLDAHLTGESEDGDSDDDSDDNGTDKTETTVVISKSKSKVTKPVDTDDDDSDGDSADSADSDDEEDEDDILAQIRRNRKSK